MRSDEPTRSSSTLAAHTLHEAGRTRRSSWRPPPSLVFPLIGLSAGLVWSFGALLAKLAKTSDAWQYLLWRSIGVLIVMELLRVSRKQRGSITIRAFRSGRLMVVGVFALMAASVGFVYAVKTTTAANAAFLSSITPLLAIVLARVFLHERLTRATVLAIVVALIGLIVMVSTPDTAGEQASIVGDLAALGSSLGFASYAVCVRSSQHRDWSPILPGYALTTIVLCTLVTLAHERTLLPPIHDLALALIHGGLLIVVGTFLFNAASRKVPAVGMAVLAQTETVFVPIWVFLGIGERPALQTIVGGLIIFAAVVGKAVWD